MNGMIETLLTAAVRAPSGDNTQPWQFEVDEAAGQIAVYLDETRDPSPMNSGQRMARIALGAALENVLRTAQVYGWTVERERAVPPAVAVVRVGRSDSSPGRVEEIVLARVTNRRLYDGRPLSADVLARLAGQTPTLEGVHTHWIVDRSRIDALAALIGRADSMMFGEPAMRRAVLSKVHFDAPANVEVVEGMSPASLELSASDRIALRLMSWLPNWLLKYGGALRIFAAKARAAVVSASGLCVQIAPDDPPETDLHVGRAMQRAWLALTAEGLAAQPMMSLPVLENALDNGTAELLASLGRTRLTALRDEFRALVPEVGGGRPAFVLRFGFAPAPSGRTGRLPLTAVTKFVSGSSRQERGVTTP
jgi:nitroreductase